MYITIDRDKCVGCAQCVNACQQGSIAMVEGKAAVVRADMCDGLGRCLPVCPVDAIHFVEGMTAPKPAFVCPSTIAKTVAKPTPIATKTAESMPSQLQQWPVQIQLVSPQAPYFADAHLLVAADCTAFAYGDFHRQMMQGRVTIIGCPKLDAVDYSQKLTQILQYNTVQTVTVARMEVPCCGGIERAVKQAIAASGKNIPCTVVTVSIQGELL